MTYFQDKQRERELRKSFKNHVATISHYADHIGPMTTVEWAQPGTNNHRVVYVLRGGVLLVYGDLGDAVYTWYNSISLNFLSGLNLDYFSGKCGASEDGRGGKEWDEDHARERFIGWLTGNYSMKCEAVEKYIDEESPEFSAFHFRNFLYNDAPMIGECDMCDAFQFQEQCEFLTGPTYLCPKCHCEIDHFESLDVSEMYSIGERPADRIHLHLIGLRMAQEQVEHRERVSAALVLMVEGAAA